MEDKQKVGNMNCASKSFFKMQTMLCNFLPCFCVTILKNKIALEKTPPKACDATRIHKLGHKFNKNLGSKRY